MKHFFTFINFVTFFLKIYADEGFWIPKLLKVIC